MDNQRIYLGIVGQIASGKGVVADYLKEKYGFQSFSLSFIVHQELRKRKIKNFTRHTLQDIGNNLRQTYGNDILARRAITYFNRLKSEKIVIEGIRNPIEVEYLRTLANFTLLGVKAKRELRFQRVLHRNKSWDPKTWEDFLRVDQRDRGEKGVCSGQQVSKCLAMANFTITNNGTKEELYHRFDNGEINLIRLG